MTETADTADAATTSSITTTESNAAPVPVGSMLFVLIEPHRGHERDFNRWYERDHQLAGCTIGPWLFASRRWVATRDLKALRIGEGVNGHPIEAGSYLTLCWIEAGHHDEHVKWATDQVNHLYAVGRGFPERTHVNTGMYMHEWHAQRDADPVPLELALDHGYGGVIATVVERDEAVSTQDLDQWFHGRLPTWLAGSPVATVASWSHVPLQDDAPSFVPRDPKATLRTVQLHFVEGAPEDACDHFGQLADDLAGSGLGRVVFASPFRPTVIGTDTYVDQLW